MLIFLVMGRNSLQIRAFFSGLPQSFCCYDTVPFGNFVFCQDNTVTAFRITAYRHGFIAKLRIIQEFNGCEESIHVAVQYHSVFCKIHGRLLCRNLLEYILPISIPFFGREKTHNLLFSLQYFMVYCSQHRGRMELCFEK